MHRRDDEKDGGDRLAGPSPAVSGPPGPTVIPFRRAKTAAGPAASSSLSADELDAFICVGEAVAAVVLRLRGGFPKIKVQRPDREDDG